MSSLSHWAALNCLQWSAFIINQFWPIHIHTVVISSVNVTVFIIIIILMFSTINIISTCSTVYWISSRGVNPNLNEFIIKFEHNLSIATTSSRCDSPCKISSLILYIFLYSNILFFEIIFDFLLTFSFYIILQYSHVHFYMSLLEQPNWVFSPVSCTEI